MLKEKNKYKKYKINQLQYVQKNYKYIYIFRYNDLKINEIIYIKKILKNLNYKSFFLKQNITKNVLLNIKGQGSLLIIFGNNYIDLFNIFNNFKKIEFIFLILEKKIYSNLKLKQVLNNSNKYLNNTLIKTYLNFLYYFKKII